MTAWEIIRLVLFAASALGIVAVAWLWWREGRPVLTGRGEMSAVPGDDVDPDAGEAYCTDPPVVDPVITHADQTLAAVDEREQRLHFALWEQQMGADR